MMIRKLIFGSLILAVFGLAEDRHFQSKVAESDSALAYSCGYVRALHLVESYHCKQYRDIAVVHGFSSAGDDQ